MIFGVHKPIISSQISGILNNYQHVKSQYLCHLLQSLTCNLLDFICSALFTSKRTFEICSESFNFLIRQDLVSALVIKQLHNCLKSLTSSPFTYLTALLGICSHFKFHFTIVSNCFRSHCQNSRYFSFALS